MSLPTRYNPGHAVDEAQRNYLAGIYVLKKLDLDPKEGGAVIPVLADHRTAPLEPVMDALHMEGLVEIDRKKQAYKLTRAGLDTIAVLIDEIEQIIEEYDEYEPEEVVEALRQRGLDVLRVRFLWGWYDGEFDDVAAYQRRRGFREVEPEWPAFITSDAFYDDLAAEIAGS